MLVFTCAWDYYYLRLHRNLSGRGGSEAAKCTKCSPEFDQQRETK
jgi:hypothetical protein